MKNFYAHGNRYPYFNTGAAILSGDVVVVVSGAAGYIGIALVDIAATIGQGELGIGGFPEGVFTLAKKAGDVFVDLQLVYWDATNKRLTSSSTGNTRAGRAFGTAASAAVSANLLLNK